MFGRLLEVLNLSVGPNPHVVGIICAANCGVSSTLRGSIYKVKKKYKIKTKGRRKSHVQHNKNKKAQVNS